MLTKRYVFRPAWLLFVGSGFLLAMLFVAGVIVGASCGTIPASTALRLQVIPNLILILCCAGWWASGHMVLKPNQVVLQGWATVFRDSGRPRRVYVRRHVPRARWHTLQVSGLLWATVTWTDEQGETVVLRHLSQGVLLRQLLRPHRQTRACSSMTQRLYTHRARGLGLLRAFALLRFLSYAGVAVVRRLYPEAAPGLELFMRRCLRRARRLFCALRERPSRITRTRTLHIEELAHPGFERAWFARLLKDMETSALAWEATAQVRTLARRMR